MRETEQQAMQKRDIIDKLVDKDDVENIEIINDILREIFYSKHKKKSTSKRVS